MTKRITTECKTLGEVISKDYADYEITFGSAPMDMDVTHGMEIEVSDNRKYGYGVNVNIYPYVEWTDGCYKPCYWGSKYYLTLWKRG